MIAFHFIFAWSANLAHALWHIRGGSWHVLEYRVNTLAYYVVMEHPTIFTGICDEMRSFHRHGRDTGFPCLLVYSKQERPPVVDHYIYKHFIYSLKSTTDK